MGHTPASDARASRHLWPAIRFASFLIGVVACGFVITSIRLVTQGSWANPLGGQSAPGDFLLAALFAALLHVVVLAVIHRGAATRPALRSLLAGVLSYAFFAVLVLIVNRVPAAVDLTWLVTALVIIGPVLVATVATARRSGSDRDPR